IACRPYKITNTLQAKHRVIDEEWDGRNAVRCIGRTGSDEGRHRSGFGDSLFENLAVFRFLVIKERVAIDRLIKLSDVGIDADLPEERLHAEGACFVRNDRNHEVSKLLVAQHLRQHAYEDHGGRSLAVFGTGVELVEEICRNVSDRLATVHALGKVPTEFLATLTQIGEFRRVVRRTVEREVLDFFVRQRNSEP